MPTNRKARIDSQGFVFKEDRNFATVDELIHERKLMVRCYARGINYEDEQKAKGRKPLELEFCEWLANERARLRHLRQTKRECERLLREAREEAARIIADARNGGAA